MWSGLVAARKKALPFGGGDARRRAVARALGALALTLFACERQSEPKRLFSCQCEFLTDTDGSSEQRVEVCAPGQIAAVDAAAGCAQAAAPAPIQGCRCEATTGKCPPDDCRAHEYR